MIVALFWISAALVLYSYAGFPLLVWIRSLVVHRSYREDDVQPSISMIVAAHNEAASIGAKIENILALDYPSERLKIFVASDGSDDGTDEIAESYANQGVRLLKLPRRGKIAALNAAAAAAPGELLVFSDANSMFAPDALRRLVRPFSDPRIGGVAGDQRYLKETSGGNAGERAYWSFERQLKRLQSRSGSTISATGAIYAVRRKLFLPAPSSVTDDFTISTGVIEQGYRLVFAPDAVAFEPVSKASGNEFGRKVRIATRGLRAVIARRKLLNPIRFGFYSLQLFSHKVARRLVAVPLCVLLVTSLLAWNEGNVYRLAAVLQTAFIALGIAGLLLEGSWLGRRKLTSLPAYFLVVNTAMLIALVNVVIGRRIDLWQPERSVIAASVSPAMPSGERSAL